MEAGGGVGACLLVGECSAWVSSPSPSGAGRERCQGGLRRLPGTDAQGAAGVVPWNS
jgi:hypothetical protein